MNYMETYTETLDTLNNKLYESNEVNVEWETYTVYTLTVGETPTKNTNSVYLTAYVDNLQPGDIIKVRARTGTTFNQGAKIKNGVVVEILPKITYGRNEEVSVITYTVDDTYDTMIFNNYRDFVTSSYCFCTKTTKRFIIDNIRNQINNIINTQYKKIFNILCLGNSFTQNVMSYVPWLIKEVEPNTEINIYMTYMGGMPISQCLAYVSNNTVVVSNTTHPTTKYENHGGWDRIYSYDSYNNTWIEPESTSDNYHKSYSLYKYDNNSEKWMTQSEIPFSEVAEMKQWDFITIQQAGSYNYADWDVYFKPYVYKILSALKQKIKHNFKFGYLMTHASYTHTQSELLTRYTGITQNAQKFINDTACEVVLPYGTALQNARTTYLNEFGASGDMMSDTAHIQNGIGCLVCAYANALQILKLMNSDKTILGSQIVIDSDFISSHNIPVSSDVLGITEENVFLAQQCAIMAIKKPFEITNMTGFVIEQ